MERDNNTGALCPCRLFALIWRCLITAGCAAGLALLFAGGQVGTLLSYFTVQSNLMVGVMFAALSVGTGCQIARQGRRGQAYHLPPWLQLGVVFIITITFLVFAFMLSGTLFQMADGVALSSVLLHYVVPVMAILDWALFLPHGLIPYRRAALWLIYPVAYMIFSCIRAAVGPPYSTGSRYPYFFMDADVLGWNLLWVYPAFLAAFFALGCLYIWVDRRLAGLEGPGVGSQTNR